MGQEMMTHAFPFGTVALVLIGIAVVGFGWWRVEGDGIAARATALYSIAFVGLFIALIAGFVLVRSVLAVATDAVPGHEGMLSQMGGMMGAGGMPSGGMPSGGMPSGGMPSGHPMVPGMGDMPHDMPGMMPGAPTAEPSPQVTTFSTLATTSPSEAPSPGAVPGETWPPDHPNMGDMPDGMMPGSGGFGGFMGSPAMHGQMMAAHHRSQRDDATAAALFLIAGLVAWWVSLGAARKLGDRPEQETYRGLVFAGSALVLGYGLIVTVSGIVHAVAPGMTVDAMVEDLQRRGGVVEIVAGGLLAVASFLVLWSVRPKGGPPTAPIDTTTTREG